MHVLHLLLLLLPCMFLAAQSATDASDVQALGNLYSSLNSPSQLSGWTTNSSDPCGESWKGISCSGSSVTSIQISGLGLNGTLGYLLSNLVSVKSLDLSNNKIHDVIPYQLPPNVTYLNLANNNLSGSLPYSVSTMHSLVYLNASYNILSQTIGDIFTNLQNLSQLDLSVNNFSGDLPNSIGSLSNLSSLYLQDNQLTGQVNVLTNLSLTTLNIANNHFTGPTPQEFKEIPNLMIGGNSFSDSPAPAPPPPYSPPPPRRPYNNPNHSEGPAETPQAPGGQDSRPNDTGNRTGLTSGQIAGIVIGSVLGGLCIILAATLCFWNFHKEKDDTQNSDRDSLGSPITIAEMITNRQLQQQKISASVANMNPPPIDYMTVEEVHGNNGPGRRTKVPLTVTSYTVASLQSATNSFSQECIVGEGSLGRVYRAEFSDGKVLAIKKIDNAAFSLQEEHTFLEAVSNISQLRHPNITALVGYCVEHGQCLLVYDYIGNGTLHDMLHYTEHSSRLTWNARVRVALGTARALEYLHEVCLPSVVHRNFKSTNILLDEELKPYLSDCGLAAFTPNMERQISTEMVGSLGYSAPEFTLSGVYTTKSDVYSFGVVMLELLTARKPLDSSRARSERSLVRWATPQLHDIDALAKMVDPTLDGMYPAKSLSRFADIIALCVQPEPEFRPPMSEVVQSLVLLVQRASKISRYSGEDSGTSYSKSAEVTF